jgi:hypothetical protein
VTSEATIKALSAALVAVTVTLVGEDTWGAVNKPFAVMVPLVAFHVTAVLLVEVRVAENWICPPEGTFALVGDKLICTPGLFAGEICAADDMPAHPELRLVATVKREMAKAWFRRRKVILLTRKPGDDSMNIFRPHEFEFAGIQACDSGVFTVEELPERL